MARFSGAEWIMYRAHGLNYLLNKLQCSCRLKYCFLGMCLFHQKYLKQYEECHGHQKSILCSMKLLVDVWRRWAQPRLRWRLPVLSSVFSGMMSGLYYPRKEAWSWRNCLDHSKRKPVNKCRLKQLRGWNTDLNHGGKIFVGRERSCKTW